MSLLPKSIFELFLRLPRRQPINYEIATKTGMETSGCSNQIASLVGLSRDAHYGEGASSRKTIYRLEDSIFLFWYRFVRPRCNLKLSKSGELFMSIW